MSSPGGSRPGDVPRKQEDRLGDVPKQQEDIPLKELNKKEKEVRVEYHWFSIQNTWTCNNDKVVQKNVKYDEIFCFLIF